MHERETHYEDEFTENTGATPQQREDASHGLNLQGDQIDSQKDDADMAADRFHQNDDDEVADDDDDSGDDE